MCSFNVREFSNVIDSFMLPNVGNLNQGSVGATSCVISYLNIPTTEVRIIPAVDGLAPGLDTVVVDQVPRYWWVLSTPFRVHFGLPVLF